MVFCFRCAGHRALSVPSAAPRHPQFTPRRYLICPHCGNRSSLTTGTLMHGAKKPIREWLLAIWWFSASHFDVSAKELQRLLGISCYQTAWTWLQKLRLAMGQADVNRCRGVVEIGCGPVAPAYERKERALVLTAAEIVLALGITGRIRMRHFAALNEETLARFLHENVEKNSSLITADVRILALLETARRQLCRADAARSALTHQRIESEFRNLSPHRAPRGGHGQTSPIVPR